MEIGRRHRHIAQARDAEYVEVIGILRDVEATLVDGVAPCRFPIIFHHPEFLIHPATDTDAVVARHTTGVDELLQAGLCGGRQRPLIAREIRIEGGWGHQCALIGADRCGDVPQRDRLWIVRKCRLEQGRITRDACQAIEYSFLVGLTGCNRRGERLEYLILEVRPVAAPMNDKTRSGIEVGRDMTWMGTLPDTDWFWQRVGPIK